MSCCTRCLARVSICPSSPRARRRPTWSGRMATTYAIASAANLSSGTRPAPAPAFTTARGCRRRSKVATTSMPSRSAPTARCWPRARCRARLVEHMRAYSPEGAQPICDVPAAHMRRIAHEYIDHACVGQTIEIDGRTMPYRPVAVTLGKTVNNGWGGFECCWARTLLATLVGGLEVPGRPLGTTVLLNRPMSERLLSVKAGPDGFMHYPLNPTDKA